MRERPRGGRADCARGLLRWGAAALAFASSIAAPAPGLAAPAEATEDARPVGRRHVVPLPDRYQLTAGLDDGLVGERRSPDGGYRLPHVVGALGVLGDRREVTRTYRHEDGRREERTWIEEGPPVPVVGAAVRPGGEAPPALTDASGGWTVHLEPPYADSVTFTVAIGDEVVAAPPLDLRFTAAWTYQAEREIERLVGEGDLHAALLLAHSRMPSDPGLEEPYCLAVRRAAGRFDPDRLAAEVGVGAEPYECGVMWREIADRMAERVVESARRGDVAGTLAGLRGAAQLPEDRVDPRSGVGTEVRAPVAGVVRCAELASGRFDEVREAELMALFPAGRGARACAEGVISDGYDARYAAARRCAPYVDASGAPLARIVAPEFGAKLGALAASARGAALTRGGDAAFAGCVDRAVTAGERVAGVVRAVNGSARLLGATEADWLVVVGHGSDAFDAELGELANPDPVCRAFVRARFEAVLPAIDAYLAARSRTPRSCR